MSVFFLASAFESKLETASKLTFPKPPLPSCLPQVKLRIGYDVFVCLVREASRATRRRRPSPRARLVVIFDASRFRLSKQLNTHRSSNLSIPSKPASIGGASRALAMSQTSMRGMSEAGEIGERNRCVDVGDDDSNVPLFRCRKRDSKAACTLALSRSAHEGVRREVALAKKRRNASGVSLERRERRGEK